MKKVMLPIIALVLSLTLVLSGCGSSESGFYKSTAEAKDVTYTSYTDLTVALDGAMVDGETLTENGNVVVTKNIDGVTYYGVFNVFDGRYTYAIERVYDLRIIETEGNGDIFKIQYDVEGNRRYKIVRSSGEVVYENLEEIEFAGSNTIKKTTYEAWKFTKDGFKNIEVLKMKKNKKTINFSTNNGIGNEITATDYMWGGVMSKDLVDYVIATRELANGNPLYVVLNKKGKIVAEYEIDKAHINGFVLVGGSLIVQYVYPVDPYSTNFDILQDGEKKSVETVKINIKTGKSKTLSKINYLINSALVIGEDFARTLVQKIDNKLVGSPVEAFIDSKGNITEAKYNYDSLTQITDKKIVAERDDERLSTFQIINNDGGLLVDLSATNVNYDYISHCDKFIIIKNVTTEKFAMIDLEGKLLTGFVYDKSLGVVNDVWLASKITQNESDGVTTTTICSIDAKGVETKQSEKKINLENVVVSNSLGEKAIIEMKTINDVVAVVKSNGEMAGKFNFALYAYNDFAKPLTTFTNITELNLQTFQINSSGNKILIVADGKVGILR